MNRVRLCHAIVFPLPRICIFPWETGLKNDFSQSSIPSTYPIIKAVFSFSCPVHPIAQLPPFTYKSSNLHFLCPSHQPIDFRFSSTLDRATQKHCTTHSLGFFLGSFCSTLRRVFKFQIADRVKV